MENISVYHPSKIEPKTNLIIAILAMGGFAFGTSEFSTMSMLSSISHSLGLSEVQVGNFVSSYALGVVIGAPIIAIYFSRFQRKSLVIFLMIFFSFGNLLSSISSEYYSILIIRFISGLPHGAFFGVSALIVSSLVSRENRAKAVSKFMLGITLSIVVGAPVATWIGDVINWRITFIFVSSISLITALLSYIFIPFDSEERASSPKDEISVLKSMQVWYVLGIAAIGFSGMFSVFSYLGPTLYNVSGIEKNWLPVVFSIFGVGSVFGAIAGGWLFDKFNFDSIGIILIGCITILFIFPYAAQNYFMVIPSVFLVGSIMALSPALQIRLMDVSKDSKTLAVSLSHAAFNIANALGPWLGGIAITYGFSWSVTGYVGAGCALIGLLIFLKAKFS